MVIKSLVKSLWFVALLTALGINVAPFAFAAEIRMGVSSRETYVGLPVTLQIQIVNAADHERPVIPEVDGLTIESLGKPSTQTSHTIINGRSSTSSTITYAFQITPHQEGTFTIPPITIRADGREQQTSDFQFVASKSETGDLLFVEVAGKQDQIYVGQALELKLKIWLRPYRDSERELTLSAADMWRMISDQTSWGAFADRVAELAASNQPVSQEVLREDGDGAQRSYYLYEIDTTVYPQRPGEIDTDDVQIVVHYPTELGTSRDPFGGLFDDLPIQMPRSRIFDDDFFSFSPFGSRLTVQSARPIVAEATVEPIDVLPIPSEGRPDDYRGAVGKYRIVTEAKPTRVKAGDPINLLIGVAGTGPMELVQAPPLAELPELTADFKVPNEPLAGFVEGDQKVFSTSIRPRREGVAQIPAIPFSYFDPDAEEFVTVTSEPITVQVAPADTLALDAIVGRGTNGPAGSENALNTGSSSESPLLANFMGEDLLENESRFKANARALSALLAVPPLLVLLIQLVRARHAAFAFASRFRSSYRLCQRRIENAKQPAEIASALQSLLVRRFKLNDHATDESVAVGALRAAGCHDLALRFERTFSQCQKAEYGGGFHADLTLSDLKSEALLAVEELQRRGQYSRKKPARIARQPGLKNPTASPLRSSASLIVLAIVLAEVLLADSGMAATLNEPTQSATQTGASQGTAPSIALTREGQRTLLEEANERYQQAMTQSAEDSAEAKQAFSEAAEKYQLIVTSGVQNSRLYFNLANAYLQSGQLGRAIANYRRALRIDPTSRRCVANLEYAERLLESPTVVAESRIDAKSWWEYVIVANGWLNRYVHPRRILVTLVLAWCVLWLAVGLRLAQLRVPWKSISCVALFAVAITATSYWLSCEENARPIGIVLSPTVTLRDGDGVNFSKVAEIQQAEGRTVKIVKLRGDWVQIRAQTGQSGWLPRRELEVI